MVGKGLTTLPKIQQSPFISTVRAGKVCMTVTSGLYF
jgi:hypothetical protein